MLEPYILLTILEQASRHAILSNLVIYDAEARPAADVQTLGGDHGGGSPDEVDSALVAVDLGALHSLRGQAEGPPQRPCLNDTSVPIMPQVRCSTRVRSRSQHWLLLHAAHASARPVGACTACSR